MDTTVDMIAQEDQMPVTQLPSLERVCRAARLNLLHWTKCQEHNETVFSNGIHLECGACAKAREQGRGTGRTVNCYFVYEPGVTIGAYSEDRKELRDLVNAFRCSRVIRSVDSFAAFAGNRGFRLKHSNKEE